MIPAAVLFVASVALGVAALVHVGRDALLSSLNTMAPRARARWLACVLAAPLGIGVFALALALGHCVLPRVLGLDDDCIRGTGGCLFCLGLPGHGGVAAWSLAGFVLLPLLRQLARSGQSAWRARRAGFRIRSIATRGPGGVWHVPGTGAFVVGWPETVVCIGEELALRLDDSALRAVTAHEDEHRAQRDIWLRTLARLCAATHLPGTDNTLLAALDLAVEQACDERASRAVADPLLVAQTLIDVARAQRDHHPGACAPSSLDARVLALCAPARRSAGAPLLGVALVLSATLAMLAGHHVHRAAETLSRFVNP